MVKKILNNYSNYKRDFEKETGLSCAEHVHAYIGYCQARVADESTQLLTSILDEAAKQTKLLQDTLAIIREKKV